MLLGSLAEGQSKHAFSISIVKKVYQKLPAETAAGPH